MIKWLKSLLWGQKPSQKAVYDKVKVVKRFKKKNASKGKKKGK